MPADQRRRRVADRDEARTARASRRDRRQRYAIDYMNAPGTRSIACSRFVQAQRSPAPGAIASAMQAGQAKRRRRRRPRASSARAGRGWRARSCSRSDRDGEQLPGRQPGIHVQAKPSSANTAAPTRRRLPAPRRHHRVPAERERAVDARLGAVAAHRVGHGMALRGAVWVHVRNRAASAGLDELEPRSGRRPTRGSACR